MTDNLVEEKPIEEPFRDSGWTADFSKFREKVEALYGDLNKFAKESPDVYAHQVLSHGFMEYSGVSNLTAKIKKQIIKEKIENGNEEYKAYEDFLEKEDLPGELQSKAYRENEQRFLELQKQEYLTWARKNNLPKNLLEMGWKEYLND